ncbi:MAG: hypothetical protein FWG30_11340 [Eubacteriaceae bacterium]|nr:hypothetical protein [Eubacteriaceae bacterium]
MAKSLELQNKLDIFNACIKFEKPARMPNLSCFYTWKVLDAGYTVSEALLDYSLMEKIVCDFHEAYGFDAYSDLGTRNFIRMGNAMGKNHYAFDDANGAVNFTDNVLMQGSEYKEFTNNPKAFIWKMVHRKYPQATKGQYVEAVSELLAFGKFSGEIASKFINEYNVPGLYNNAAICLCPVEDFYSYYRGIKEISIDMRKRPEELKEAIDFMFEESSYPAFKASFGINTSSYVFNTFTALLAHSIMSVKQFEIFYWPHLKRLIDAAVENGKTLYIFSESSMMRFADFFQDIPKGYVVLHPELDDVFELRKKLPNICIAGGMKTELLGRGTPEECINYAKKLIGEMGEGYIFSQDKMVSFRNDCNRDNLLAVNEFVRNCII